MAVRIKTYVPGSGYWAAYFDRNAGEEFQTDTKARGRPQPPPRILGETAGNAAFRAGIYLGKGGVPTRTGATDAILYEVMNKPGRFGYSSPRTERFRTKYQSRGWLHQLKRSTKSNKAPFGTAQSSVDTTIERYATIETRYLNPGIHDRDEQWNTDTKTWERKWKGWKALKISDKWRHYTPLAARMFKEEGDDDNEGKGRSRRFVRSII